MFPFLQSLRTYLDALQPGLFNAILAALLWVALWGLRKFKPLFFAKLPPALQAWPALALGAVVAALSASTDGGAGQAVLNALGMAFTGLLSGAMSVGVHRVLKESPLPYGAHDVPPKPPTAPLVAILCLVLVGCGGSNVPATGPCSVTERTLIGSDYEAELASDCAADKTCPHADEIKAKRDARRKAWVECLPP